MQPPSSPAFLSHLRWGFPAPIRAPGTNARSRPWSVCHSTVPRRHWEAGRAREGEGAGERLGEEERRGETGGVHPPPYAQPQPQPITSSAVDVASATTSSAVDAASGTTNAATATARHSRVVRRVPSSKTCARAAAEAAAHAPSEAWKRRRSSRNACRGRSRRRASYT